MTTPDDAVIAQAVRLLRAGELVAFPTETVYGLGADAENPAALARLYAIKGRPAGHPVILHLARSAQLADYAAHVPQAAWDLAAAFWPGPLTLILARGPRALVQATGGQNAVGLRVPAHPVAQRLLAAFGGALAAPSANRFGKLSPTSAAHVRSEFGAAMPLVLDGGDCAVGIESTIVDLTGVVPRLLRPGAISAAQLAAVLGRRPSQASGRQAPGTLARHYAPGTPLEQLGLRALRQRRASLLGAGAAVATLHHGALPPDWAPQIALPAEPAGYAQGLYRALRWLDAQGCQSILVQALPATAPWRAVADRLARAAAGSRPGAADHS